MKNSGNSALQRRREYYRIAGLLTAIISILLLLGVLLGIYFYPRSIGPVQPIPFSHRVHAGKKQISCLVCHPEAAITYTGGIPPLERCMNCHSRIVTQFAPVRNLVMHYEKKEPVRWTKINNLPDFVYFPHSVHVYRSIDCSKCHGEVNKMDRIMQVNEKNMGFCISCHRTYNAPVDCFTCHR